MKNGIIIFLITIAAFVIYLPSYKQMEDLKAKNADYDQRIKDLKKEQVALQEEVKRLKDDPVYLEKVAREKMGLIKDGEVIYKIVPPPEESDK